MMLIRRQLSTFELDKALRSNIDTGKLYAGTFPVDLLPRFRPRPHSLIVVNKGTSQTSGTHWILIYIPCASSENRGSWFLFDSLGKGAEGDKYLLSYFDRCNPVRVKFNKLQLQHMDSNSCGYFVLSVAWLIARGVSPSSLHHFFSASDLASNDVFVKKVVSTQFTLT